MSELKNISKKTFQGGVDTDRDYHTVPNGDFIAATNIRNGYGSTLDAVSNARGNVEVDYRFPDGDNKCIGVVENKQNGTILYFVWNSNDEDSILQYDPNDGVVGTVSLVYQKDLGFEEDWLISSAKVVDGDLLYWTDGVVEKDVVADEVIYGNPPRKINIEKAKTVGTFLTYELYFSDSSYAVGAQYFIEVQDLDGGVITSNQLLYTVPAGPPAPNIVVGQLITALATFDVTGTANYAGATQLTKIEVVHDDSDRRIFITGVGANDLHFTPINHYPVDLDNNWITVIKPIPKCAPKPRYVVDANLNSDKIFNNTFYFRYRYIFDDKEKSKWSAISYVPTNFAPISGAATNSDVDNDNRYSKIVIELEDANLDDQDAKSLIRKVEIAVKYSFESVWRSVKVYSIDEVGIVTHEFDFTNEGNYSVVASDENGDADVQALGNFDFVPKLSLTNELVYNDSGNNIMLWAGNLENYDVPEIKATVTPTTATIIASPYPADQTLSHKGLKGGGVYDVGVIYEDWWGRQSANVYLGTVKFPFGFNFRRTVEVDFLTPPPEWAIRYRITLSKNQNQARYVQLPAWRCIYWIIDPSDETGASNTTTSYAAGDATHISFECSINDIQNGDIRNTLFDDSLSNNILFIPEPKDRLQIINIIGTPGSTTPLDIEQYNFPIIGYSPTYPTTGVSLDRFNIYIKFNPNDPDFATASGETYTVEMYRPGDNSGDNLPYEIADCYDIVDDPDPLKRTHGPTVDLSEYGDTYNTSRTYENSVAPATINKVAVVQRPTLYIVPQETGEDHGRPVVNDPDYGEIFSYSDIRSTGTFMPNSLVNGLSSFRGTDYIQISRQFGPIEKLALLDKVLLAIAHFETQAIYVSKDTMMDLSGTSLVGRTDKLLNLADEFQYDLGTHNPESVIINEGKIYAWDSFKGVAWRYSGGSGQFPISEYGKRNDFLALGKELYRKDKLSTRAYGGLQREFGMYYITFDAPNFVPYTLGFQEKGSDGSQKNKWTGGYSWIPEYHGGIGLNYVTFKDGALWLHEQGDYCEYYDVEYDCDITFVINDYPSAVKLFWTIWQASTDLWTADRIFIPPTPSYPGGMESQLIANKWNLYEGQYKADLLRDMTDNSAEFSSIGDPALRAATALLRGRPLRGEVMNIKLTLNNSQELAILRNVSVKFSPSNETS